MYIDYKVTCWKRLDFDSVNDFSDAITLLKSDKSIDDICENFENITYLDIDNTEEFITTEENNAPVIEAYANKQLIYQK